MVITRFYVDDGNVEDLKVAALLEKYGFTGIFYIAPFFSKIKIMSVRQIQELSQKHEIGGHTLNHALLTNLPKEAQLKEILDGKIVLEDIIKKRITKFAYPKGWQSPEVIDSVISCGFEEARTMDQGRDNIGIVNLDGFGKYEIPVSVHFYPGRAEKWKEVYESAKALGKRGSAYFGVTCHGVEMNKYNLWPLYEEMLKFISEDQKI